MADLDTRSKRASSVQVLGPATLTPVLPDGTIGQGDRQHIAWTYSGIAAAAPGGVTLMAMERTKFRRMFGRVFGRVN
jgi:hypothetical protein